MLYSSTAPIQEMPVWVWLPGAGAPVSCGIFAQHGLNGNFRYCDMYRRRSDAFPLDPVHLPLTSEIFTEQRNNGIFNVFRDSGPWAFTRLLLQAQHGNRAATPLNLLELQSGESFGAIALCHDPTGKHTSRPLPSADLLTVLAQMPANQPTGCAVLRLLGLSSTYSGEQRPRLTVHHCSQHWFAKFNDSPRHHPFACAREFTALQLARIAGIDAVEAEMHHAGETEVLLTRRFDRYLDEHGRIHRTPYLSACSLLGIDLRHTAEDEPSRSYLVLQDTWARLPGISLAHQTAAARELWRRIVLSVCSGNGDDHILNHGFLYQNGTWRWAPAFDIFPTLSYRGRQCLSLTRQGSFLASRQNLLACAQHLGWALAEASEYLHWVCRLVLTEWPRLLRQAGVPRESFSVRDPALWLDGKLPLRSTSLICKPPQELLSYA